jgi:hypothetical protein
VSWSLGGRKEVINKLMRNYNLNIAEYNIRFESAEDGPEL